MPIYAHNLMPKYYAVEFITWSSHHNGYYATRCPVMASPRRSWNRCRIFRKKPLSKKRRAGYAGYRRYSLCHRGGRILGNLEIVPVDLDEANEFVREHHRHHAPVPGAKFCVGVSDGEKIVGVAIVGRPVSRMLDKGWTLEVNRTCTDGTKNANSMLYGACRRVCFGLGYRRLITYTLPSEGGISLTAAGWKCLGERGVGSWSRPSRPRVDTHPTQRKILWEAVPQ